MNDSPPIDDMVPSQGIAIIGASGRFPGANSVEQFWSNLRAGVESISFFTDEELLSNGVDKSTLRSPNYVKAIGALDDIEGFDAPLFNMTPREAELTDPQHRIFLECAWEALEHAGYDPAKYAGAIGVYAGCVMNSYLLNNLLKQPGLVDDNPDVQTSLGNDKDHLTTRVSYKFNLTGPSIAIQTSCSTSLVAVHVACQSLWNGECDMALAGGISITVPEKVGYFYHQGGITSPDGHCRAFDSKAQGTVGGDGAALVLLKPYELAVADGDTIYAVIRGSAINNDGHNKVGYTAPSIAGQLEAIATAQAMADFAPDTISYIEAHGTGTTLGDPIEVKALTKAFREGTDKKQFCGIGSVKTNIGHLDAAAGTAGLIKAALAMRHKELPPSLNYDKPNPEIDFENTPFFVVDKLIPWTANGTPRRAGVSSFGLGGTNAHVVLEEAPQRKPSSESRRWQLLHLSANSSTALENTTARLAQHLKDHRDLDLADVSYTLKLGRRDLNFRRVVACRSTDDAIKLLDNPDSTQVFTGKCDSPDPPVAFLFPGQGSQYVRMGLGLYESETTFRESVDRCAELLLPHLNADIRDILYPPPSKLEESAQQLNQTSITQPALFTIQYALAQLWTEWGIQPDCMLGHSVGEFVAACLAGVFELEEALRLVAARGRLIQELPPGEMIAINLSETEVSSRLGNRLSLAALNGPRMCVVSGPSDAISSFKSQLDEDTIVYRELRTSHAFHSAMMEPILEPFQRLVEQVTLRPPQIPFVSSVTGTWITNEEATDPRYWAKHCRQTVRFSPALDALLDEPTRVLLEVGPGQTLASLARHQSGTNSQRRIISSMRHPKEEQPDDAFLLVSLGQLWLAGKQINWSAFYDNEQRHRLPLPTYPFEHQRYWIDPVQRGRRTAGPRSAERTSSVGDWFYVPGWKRSVPCADLNSNQDRQWLVFCGQSTLSSQIIEQLQRHYANVTVVGTAESFAQIAGDHYAINPARADDYHRLLSALSAAGKLPQSVVHLFCADTPRSRLDTETLAVAQDQGFNSVLFFAQAIYDIGESEPLQINVVTNNVQDVTGCEDLHPEYATVAGACRVIHQEMPNITCRAIDISPVAGESLGEQLVEEFRSVPTEGMLAIRGRHRWVQTYQPIYLSGEDDLPPRLRDKGVYLITGGLGGVGFEVAEYLARTVNAKLVLASRSELPPIEDWEKWLHDHDEVNLTSQRIRRVQLLEQLGSEVQLAVADVTNEEQMRKVLMDAKMRFGGIHGVVHAAGADKTQHLIHQSNPEDWSEHMLPKLTGLIVLEKTLQEHQPDFCLVQSSLSSILGAVGYVAYAAAHHFVDAFAEKCNRRSRTDWLVVNWDNWFTWRDPEPESPDVQAEYYMTRSEGAEALHRALSANHVRHLVVSTGDLESRIDRWVRLESPAEKEEALGEVESGHRRPDLPYDYVAPRTDAEKRLAEIWGQTLGISQVGIHDNFFELGGDSVLSIQVIAKANRAGLRVTPKQVFDNETIAELAEVIGSGTMVEAEQEPITGVLPFTPIQHWFFERQLTNPGHFNMSLVLETTESLDVSILQEVINRLVTHHDVLRLRFERDHTGWSQCIERRCPPILVKSVDVSNMVPGLQEAALKEWADTAHASLRLDEPPLLRVAIFNRGEPDTDRLVLIGHHLLLDAVSMRILVDDICEGYECACRGESCDLPTKTSSYRQWAKRIKVLAQSDQLGEESNYWLSLPWEKAKPIPTDLSRGVNDHASARNVSVGLSTDETRALLQEVPAKMGVKINAILFTAMAQAFRQWSGHDAWLADVEGLGRHTFSEHMDVSRTVGWFTSLYPVLLTLEKTHRARTSVKNTHEQLQCMPNDGAGFGLLRYLRQDPIIAEKLRQLPAAEVSFLYLGQTDQQQTDSRRFRMLPQTAGSPIASSEPRFHLLEIMAMVTDTLTFKWVYSENFHQRSTIDSLAQSCVSNLRELIRECTAGNTDFTPADFPVARVSQKDLDKLMAQVVARDREKNE